MKIASSIVEIFILIFVFLNFCVGFINYVLNKKKNKDER